MAYTTSKAPAVKAALVTTLTAALAEPIQVYYGFPDTFLADDIVSVGNARGTQASASLGAQSREESVEVDVVVSCFRGGGAESQQTVTERAFTVMASVEDALIGPPVGSGDPTLGNVVRFTEVTGYVLTETPPDMISAGRLAEIVITVLAHVRL